MPRYAWGGVTGRNRSISIKAAECEFGDDELRHRYVLANFEYRSGRGASAELLNESGLVPMSRRRDLVVDTANEYWHDRFNLRHVRSNKRQVRKNECAITKLRNARVVIVTGFVAASIVREQVKRKSYEPLVFVANNLLLLKRVSEGLLAAATGKLWENHLVSNRNIQSYRSPYILEYNSQSKVDRAFTGCVDIASLVKYQWMRRPRFNYLNPRPVRRFKLLLHDDQLPRSGGSLFVGSIDQRPKFCNLIGCIHGLRTGIGGQGVRFADESFGLVGAASNFIQCQSSVISVQTDNNKSNNLNPSSRVFQQRSNVVGVNAVVWCV